MKTKCFNLFAIALSCFSMITVTNAQTSNPTTTNRVITQQDGNTGRILQNQEQHTVLIGPETGISSMPQYRLGMTAVDGFGYVEVRSVNWGSLAQRMGLEWGDRILQINYQPVRSVSELQMRLQQAARYNGGRISVLVDNVRARRGEWGAPARVMVTAYLDGFGPGNPNILSDSGFPSNRPIPTSLPITNNSSLPPQSSNLSHFNGF